MKMWNKLAQGHVKWWTSVPLVLNLWIVLSENEFKHSNEGGWSRIVITP
jgi:hypothetical protein